MRPGRWCLTRCRPCRRVAAVPRDRWPRPAASTRRSVMSVAGMTAPCTRSSTAVELTRTAAMFGPTTGTHSAAFQSLPFVWVRASAVSSGEFAGCSLRTLEVACGDEVLRLAREGNRLFERVFRGERPVGEDAAPHDQADEHEKDADRNPQLGAADQRSLRFVGCGCSPVQYYAVLPEREVTIEARVAQPVSLEARRGVRGTTRQWIRIQVCQLEARHGGRDTPRRCVRAPRARRSSARHAPRNRPTHPSSPIGASG